MPRIVSGGSATTHWILRGDRAGEYDIAATYTGAIEPIGSSLRLAAASKDPIKVWGTDAINVRANAERVVRKGKPYRILVGLENISDAPVYNAGLEFGPVGGTGDFTPAPWNPDSVTFDVIEPTETAFVELYFIPSFDGVFTGCSACHLPLARFFSFAAVEALDEPTGLTAEELAGFATSLAAGDEGGLDPANIEVVEGPTDDADFDGLRRGSVDDLSWEPIAGAAGYRLYTDTGTGFGEPIALPAGTTALTVRRDR